MKELVAEYNCFIRNDSSNNIQLTNHSRINNYETCEIISAKYKHKIPNLEMVVEHKGYENNCKTSAENTTTKILTEIDDLNKSKSNYIVYFSGSEAHFVPLMRPVLNTFITTDIQPEYKKNSKDKSKGDYSNFSECKKSYETFREVSVDGKFKVLNDNDKIKQPWIPVVLKRSNNNITECQQSLLLCYEREELSDLDEPVKLENRKSICDINPSKTSIVKRSNSVSSMESEILHIFLDCNVISFSKLMESIKKREMVDRSQISEKLVLNYLPTIALLIRGHFVIKSEILYKFTESDSEIPLENWCLTRDYILSLFYSGESISTTAIKSITSMPSAKITKFLTDLSERMSDSKNGPWKFAEHDYDFITKNSIFNQHQIEIMDNKVREVCLKLRIDHISKRCRTNSSNSQDTHCSSPGKKRAGDFSPSKMPYKRLRQDSSGNESLENCNSKITTVVNEHYTKLSIAQGSETLINTKEHLSASKSVVMNCDFPLIKGEPCMSPRESPDREYILENETYSIIKTEANDNISEKENMKKKVLTNSRETTTTEQTNQIPEILLDDIKQFLLLQLSSSDLLPIRNLAKTFQEEVLIKLPVYKSGKCSGLTNDSLTRPIVETMEKILTELQVTKIDIKWPSLKTALEPQPIYLSSNESGENVKIFSAVIHLLNTQGYCSLNDVKNEITARKTMELIPNNNTLRDKLKKFCNYVHRKYYLKFTVSDR